MEAASMANLCEIRPKNPAPMILGHWTTPTCLAARARHGPGGGLLDSRPGAASCQQAYTLNFPYFGDRRSMLTPQEVPISPRIHRAYIL
jgi:hypothetical protein